MAKNKIIAYFLWIVGGWWGLHHFYLNRDRQAFVWSCTGGLLGLGLLRDFWRIPEYVQFANREPRFMDRLHERVDRLETPPFSPVRFLAEVCFGVFLGYLSALAIPDNISVMFPVVRMLLVPTAVALGVHTVGNIGYEGGPYRPAICGALIMCPFFMLPNGIICQSFVSATLFQWERVFKDVDGAGQDGGIRMRLVILGSAGFFMCVLFVSVFLSNASITPADGEPFTLPDALDQLAERMGIWWHAGQVLCNKLGGNLSNVWQGCKNYLFEIPKELERFTEKLRVKMTEIVAEWMYHFREILVRLYELLKETLVEIWNSPKWEQLRLYTVTSLEALRGYLQDSLKSLNESTKQTVSEMWNSPVWGQIWSKISDTAQTCLDISVNISSRLMEAFSEMWNSPVWGKVWSEMGARMEDLKELIADIWNSQIWNELRIYIVSTFQTWKEYLHHKSSVLMERMKESISDGLDSRTWGETWSSVLDSLYRWKDNVLGKFRWPRWSQMWSDISYSLNEWTELLSKIFTSPKWKDLWSDVSDGQRWGDLWLDIKDIWHESHEMTPYRVLRLHKDATKEDIKRQYRRLALIYHPDKYTDVSGEEAERKFIELREAYETLLKVKKREARERKTRP